MSTLFSLLQIVVLLSCFLAIRSEQYVFQMHYADSNCKGAYANIDVVLLTRCVLADGAYYEASFEGSYFTEKLGCSTSACDVGCYVHSFPVNTCLTQSLYGINNTYEVSEPTTFSDSLLTQPNAVYAAAYEGPNCNILDEIDIYFPSFCSPWNSTHFYTSRCTSDKNVINLLCSDSDCSLCVTEGTFTNGKCTSDSYGDFYEYFCGDATPLAPHDHPSSAATLRGIRTFYLIFLHFLLCFGQAE
eukprot:TRINITY_DN22413_c0_g1_i1.p1 TRINITY_DN22413_c0_g1~~TRINITY_DN22413_c0_g1_i1.p1  ORF type:complete len:244 (+),score=4.32 TRINITY_DN22413_c0_g1_i1:445-1176(+)